MDLRVYLDGVSRIVSGVTLETTCKDIVLCLAQATQQFGKFILVERCGNNERLLNPNDYPIKVLSQWGEYAPNVVFIMKRCDQPLNESNVKLPASANNISQLQNQHKNSSLHQQQQTRSNETTSVRSRVDQASRLENKLLKPANFSTGSNDHYGTCLPTKNFHYQGEKLINPPCKSSSHLMPPNQNYIPSENPADVESDYGTNQALAKRPKRPPPYYEAITKSALLRSSPSDPVEASPETSSNHWSQGDNMSKFPNETIRCSSFEEQEDSLKTFKLCQNSEEPQSRQNPRQDETKLVELSSLQKDTLNVNNRQILEITSPVNYWDTKYLSSGAQQRQDNISDDLRLESNVEAKHELMGNIELREIDEEEVSIVELANRGLEVDKNKLRMQLSVIENQIADCRQSIEQLMDQINQLNLQKEEEELLKRREEEKMRSQLLEMTKEKSIEFERQSEQLRMVDEELKESDEMLKERIKKIEKILHDLKEANLQGLSLLPREELFSKNNHQMKTSQSHVIINPDSRNSYQAKQQRPGSTRKMFVPPRELKNAVATSKNPHGVWV